MLNSNNRKALPGGRAFLYLASAAKSRGALLRRGWGEPFAFAARLWFRLWFGGFLDFFSAFILVSHECKCVTKGVGWKRTM
jgi:hypothetical protein